MTRAKGFTAYVRANDRRSLALILGFLIALQVGAFVLLYMPLSAYDPEHAPGNDVLAYAARYVPLVTLGGAALFAMRMLRHVGSVRDRADVRIVDRVAERRLFRLLEPLAIALGLPVPDLGVIESPALNAFACGSRRADALVIVTRGLLDGLDDDELAGVLAHELVHIRNGDIRLMAVAHTLVRGLQMVDRVNRRRLGGPWSLVYFAVALPAMVPLVLAGHLLNDGAFRLGLLSRLLIASARERIADAEAVRLTQDPAAFISALTRIEGRSAMPDLPCELDAMMIAAAIEGGSAAHPGIADRIAALTALAGPMAVAARGRRDTGPTAGFGPRHAPVFGRRQTTAFDRVATEAALLRGKTERDRGWLDLRPTRSARLIQVAAVAGFCVFYLCTSKSPPGHALRPLLQAVDDARNRIALAVHRDTLSLQDAGAPSSADGRTARDDGRREPTRVINHEENCRRARRRSHPEGEIVDCRGL